MGEPDRLTGDQLKYYSSESPNHTPNMNGDPNRGYCNFHIRIYGPFSDGNLGDFFLGQTHEDWNDRHCAFTGPNKANLPLEPSPYIPFRYFSYGGWFEDAAQFFDHLFPDNGPKVVLTHRWVNLDNPLCGTNGPGDPEPGGLGMPLHCQEHPTWKNSTAPTDCSTYGICQAACHSATEYNHDNSSTVVPSYQWVGSYFWDSAGRGHGDIECKQNDGWADRIQLDNLPSGSR